MPADFESWLRSKLLFLGFTALTIGVAYLGYRVYKTRARTHSSSSQLPPKRAAGGAREYELPKACRCVSCSYIWENPGKHCPELVCPKCGGKMMRSWELEKQGQ